MGSDRARVSYDETRQYRSVVMQQGRVTVEADWNEGQQIATEEERKEALDFVGPAGTPDDGYRVLDPGTAPNPPFDFTVDAGTMYVGGVRAFSPSPITYSKQSDWLDHSTDPDWVDPAGPQNQSGNEEVYLLLREQEVSAVEDTALREVALGGPDTAQRTRLIQHIVRSLTDDSNCQDAVVDQQKKWKTLGLDLDLETMRLTSESTLLVTFPTTGGTPDPCEPPATGGYLGADNQLIRVQISSTDGKGNFKFVWGFDDASFLYRVTATDSQNLKLQSTPVDQFHQPRAGQAVEALRSAAKLSSTDFVASPTGIVQTLTAPYNADQKTVTLPTGLPASYTNTTDTPVLFLRVWEEEKAVVAGTAIDLGSTGMQVTLNAPGGAFHVGDFWLIAVRPSTPTKVYPQRYLDGPQPPDGPRLWFCPLAVIDWKNGILNIVEDCRNPFDNLVDLTKRKFGGCCTVTVRPEDLKQGVTLQSVVDKFVHKDKVVICLMPGVYKLDATLRLGPEHSNLTIEACHDGAVLAAAPGKETNFIDGLIVLTRANNVTLQGLRFDLPQVPFRKAGGKLGNLDEATQKQIVGSLLEDLSVSIGIRPVHCALLAVKNCLFRFSLTENKDVFGVGIFASSECWGLKITGCRFVHEERYLKNTGRPFRILAGFLLLPSVIFKGPHDPAGNVGRGTTSFIRTILNDAYFEENLFQGLTVAAIIYAIPGVVTIENNTVRDCRAGIWLLSLSDVVFSTQSNAVTVDKAFVHLAQAVRQTLQSAIDPIIVIGVTIGRSYPLPAEFDAKNAINVPEAKTKEVKKAVLVQRTVDQVAGVAATTAASGETTITSAKDEAAKTKEETAKAKAAKVKADLVELADTSKKVFEAEGVGDATLRSFLNLNDQVTNVTQRAAALGPKVDFALTLRVTGNEIDTRIKDAISNVCLLVIDEDTATQSCMTMTANTFRSFAGNAPTAAILLVERCAVTGNIIVNEELVKDNDSAISLAMMPGGATGAGAAVAITGNVFQARAVLPDRGINAPSPMDTWLFLNTQVIK